MPKSSNNEDQFKFLISCIRHSVNGKIDFERVAEECEVVTKGAAAKRYERMMKAHGIHQPQGPTGRDTGVQPLKSTTKAKALEPPAKKRKRTAKDSLAADSAMDSDDGGSEKQAIKTEFSDTDIRSEHAKDTDHDYVDKTGKFVVGDNNLGKFVNTDPNSAGEYSGVLDSLTSVVIKNETGKNSKQTSRSVFP